jgi:hypothetical protein
MENGKKKADVCREFGLVNSTIQTIRKNRTKITVTARTIHNCFHHAGILSAQGVNVTENEDDFEVETVTAAAADDDDYLPLFEWVRKNGCDVLGRREYDAYATIDDDIVTTEAQTDEVRHKNGKLDPEQEEDKEEEEEEQKAEVPIPTLE